MDIKLGRSSSNFLDWATIEEQADASTKLINNTDNATTATTRQQQQQQQQH